MENETINEAAEEMKWEAKCDINELPARLRRLAIYRKQAVRPGHCVKVQGTVGCFSWADTPEKYSFWQQVYYGDVPANLEKVLDQFEREHPELLDETEEVNEETNTKQTDGKYPEQFDKPEQLKEPNRESDISEKVEEARKDAAHTIADTIDPWLESVARDNEEKIRRLVELGVLDTPENTAVRDHNIGASDYAKHIFQPWVAWQEYNLDPWDADIVKRVLRNKAGESRILDYEKIKHICDEKIRQLKIK